MKRIFVLVISVCLIFTLLSGCVKDVHYSTFNELLASEEIKDFPSDERETLFITYHYGSKELCGEFQHLTEYSRLSDSIAEFAVISVLEEDNGTWYHPFGYAGNDYLIFVTNDGTASIWGLDDTITYVTAQ